MHTASPITIVLADDDPDDRFMAQEALESSRLANDLVMVEDGEQLMDYLLRRNQYADVTTETPGLILLDLNMPRMNGIEFLEAIRADDTLKDTVVFVLTTSDDDIDRARAYRQQIAGYMVKAQVGPGFRKAAELLNTYWSTVRLPQ